MNGGASLYIIVEVGLCGELRNSKTECFKARNISITQAFKLQSSQVKSQFFSKVFLEGTLILEVVHMHLLLHGA